jgi:hypothetical protein
VSKALVPAKIVMTKSRSDEGCGSQKGCSCRSPLAPSALTKVRFTSSKLFKLHLQKPGAGDDLLPERASTTRARDWTAHSSTSQDAGVRSDAAVAIFTQRWTHRGASCSRPFARKHVYSVKHPWRSPRRYRGDHRRGTRDRPHLHDGRDELTITLRMTVRPNANADLIPGPPPTPMPITTDLGSRGLRIQQARAVDWSGKTPSPMPIPPI